MAFLDNGGSFTQIAVPGTFFTEALSINDAGQIVGEFILSIESIAGTHHGFLDNRGIFIQIDAPGAVTGAGNSTIASGINDAGQIVGSVNFGHGFLATPIPEPITSFFLASDWQDLA
jgi:uncharacterized membrane protein